MRATVTGGAGFIGSHLCEALCRRGVEVTAVDCFTPYYDRALKGRNRDAVVAAGARFLDDDLCSADLEALLHGSDVVFHLAAQPGVRASWQQFSTYLSLNLDATQRLLEAARRLGTSRVVVASSSSVYGNADRYPVEEADDLHPFSPYGVTKRAVEDLCGAYAMNWGVPTVLLRYFTVYGPRQRPDMAIARMVAAALGGPPFPLYGTGAAVRDFTFVDDVVAATIAAGDADLPPATPINVAGGSQTTVQQLLDLVGEAAGAPVPVEQHDAVAGDVTRTGGVTDRASELLEWAPAVSVTEGISQQVAWARAQHAAASSPP